MEVKTIKDVDPSVWAELKGLAERNSVPMGKMLGKVVQNYKEESRKSWDRILNAGKILSDEEANAMLKDIKRWRKEYGFRDISH